MLLTLHQTMTHKPKGRDFMLSVLPLVTHMRRTLRLLAIATIGVAAVSAAPASGAATPQHHVVAGQRLLSFETRTQRDRYVRKHVLKPTSRAHAASSGTSRLFDLAGLGGISLAVGDDAGLPTLTAVNCFLNQYLKPVCINMDNRTTSVATSAARSGITSTGAVWRCGGVLLYNGSNYTGASYYVPASTAVTLTAFNNLTSSVDAHGICTLQQS